MSKRKLHKENIRKIQHSNGTYYITIPIRIIRNLKWKERQKVVVNKTGKEKITITDWPQKKAKSTQISTQKRNSIKASKGAEKQRKSRKKR